MLRRVRDALGWLTGSLLGVLVIAALAIAPVILVLWAGVALGVPWASVAQLRLYLGAAALFNALDRLLPPWAWFIMFTLAWLAFLDLHVRWLVREEFSKLKALNERGDP